MDLVLESPLPDVQASRDRRNLPIQKVGVKSVAYPLTVMTREGAQASVASFDMFVGLPGDVKGTHMSRFLEVLEAFRMPLSSESLGMLMAAMLDRLEAPTGFIEARMPFFVRKAAPVSGVPSLLDHQLTLRAEQTTTALETTVQVQTPVTSLCPCSKEISRYGAHNQRSHVVIAATLRTGAAMPVEDLIDIAEASASCQLWGLLKRADEKYVTERAYENPMFVEDLVRDIAMALSLDRRIARYEVSSENFESIHNHSAFAWISGPR